MKEAKGGRPRHNKEAKTAPIGIRVDPELRRKVEEAALAGGRSMTLEIERRLKASFGMPVADDNEDQIRAIVRDELVKSGLVVQRDRMD